MALVRLIGKACHAAWSCSARSPLLMARDGRGSCDDEEVGRRRNDVTSAWSFEKCLEHGRNPLKMRPTSRQLLHSSGLESQLGDGNVYVNNIDTFPSHLPGSGSEPSLDRGFEIKYTFQIFHILPVYHHIGWILN